MRNYVKMLLTLFVFLSLQRISYLCFFFEKWRGQNFSSVGLSLLAGVRFDLMVLGYALSLFAILGFPWIQALFVRLKFFTFISKLVLIFELAVFSVLGFFDFEWTHLYADRFNSSQTLSDFILAIPLDLFLLLNICASGFLFLVILIRIFRLRLSWSHGSSFISWLLLLLALALMIRGSLDEHHLDLRHSKVTASEFLNQASLSSAYALDQALRHRR